MNLQQLVHDLQQQQAALAAAHNAVTQGMAAELASLAARVSALGG
jgi:hypothetical protein